MLILASSSPQRERIIRQMGAVPDRIISPDIDESILLYESPSRYVGRMSAAKAISVVSRLENSGLVLASDTIICVKNRILQKARDKKEIAENLRLYSGRKIQILTSVTLIKYDNTLSQQCATKINLSTIRCKRLSEDEISRYVELEEGGTNITGGVSITGIGAAFFYDLCGSYSGIVGLPSHETYMMLRGMGYKF